MRVRDAIASDLPALLALSNHGIRHLDANWTEREETLEEKTAWFEQRTGSGFPVLVAVDAAERFLGFGSYGPYRAKDGYRLTVEHTIYVDAEAQGKGVGKALLARLIELARDDGRHLLIGVIDDQNETSIKLHEKFGFTIAGRLPQSGVKNGRWLGQVSMILQLDDRDAPGDA